MRQMKNQPRPIGILTADWHLRQDTPACRRDDFLAKQRAKVVGVLRMSQTLRAPVYHAGDLFHHWNPPLELLEWFCRIGFTASTLYVLPGNHDLPYHRDDHLPRSGLGVLIAAGVVSLIAPGDPPGVQFIHKFVYENMRPPEWMKKAGIHVKQAREEAQEPLLVAGDNHHGFLSTLGERRVLVPGCLTRQSTTEMDCHPTVWVLYSDGDLQPEVLAHEEAAKVCKAESETPTVPERDFSAFLSEVNSEDPAGGTETMLRRALAEALKDAKQGVKDRVLRAMEDKP